VRLASAHGATAVPIGELPDLLGSVDIVVCATTSPQTVITEVPQRATKLLILDLAVPHDVDPAVAANGAVTLVNIERLRHAGTHVAAADITAAEDIVAAEVEAFVAWHQGTDVAPTVAALRSRADDVVTAELRRLSGRMTGLTDDQRAEIAHSMHRVVQRLLHEPTVRVRQRAGEPGGEAYASVLRELFDLPAPLDLPMPLDVTGALEAGPEARA
jgi:glutamyl-tRNA reductase